VCLYTGIQFENGLSASKMPVGLLLTLPISILQPESSAVLPDIGIRALGLTPLHAEHLCTPKSGSFMVVAHKRSISAPFDGFDGKRCTSISTQLSFPTFATLDMGINLILKLWYSSRVILDTRICLRWSLYPLVCTTLTSVHRYQASTL
jgi:hypothetical protein